MDLEQFLAATEPVSLGDITTVLAHRTASGADVEAAVKTQIELRSSAMSALLTKGESENRDLLASEQRAFDRAGREKDELFRMLRQVEQRTEQRNHVPATQSGTQDEQRTADDESPVLRANQSVAGFVARRGNVAYVGERGANRMRFGSVVRALALGDRRGLSDLERRALSEGTDAAGGYTVPDVLAAQFIDRVRNATVVMRAGAMTVPMTSDVLHLARLAQPGAYDPGTSPVGAGAQWKVENDDIVESDLTLERVTFQARTLPMLISLSVELSEDSSNIDQIIETEMAGAMAVELDRAALRGSGTPPEPRGIKNQSGVTTTAGVGAVTDYDWMIDAVGACWSANHEPNARIYGATLAKAIAKYKSSADDQPLILPAALATVREFRSNQAASGEAYFGDFTQLMIGIRTSFRLEASRVAGEAFGKLQIAIRAYLRADVQLAHPAAFTVCTGVS